MQLTIEHFLHEVEMDAIIDDTGQYRYSLTRLWDKKLPKLVFLMLNPSTANDFEDDPTIRRCLNFAKRWGFGSIEVVNLFAFRATNPNELLTCLDPIGKENDKYIKNALKDAELVIVAWGTKGTLLNRNEQVIELLNNQNNIYCLALTKEGHPKHPLYIKNDEKPKKFITII